MLMIKNIKTEITNACDRLISKLDMAEERVSELGDLSIESLKAEKQRDKQTNNTEGNILGL